jgi:hypothetical protein
VTRLIDVTDLAHGETSYEFEGRHHGDTGVSFIVVRVRDATAHRRGPGSTGA